MGKGECKVCGEKSIKYRRLCEKHFLIDRKKYYKNHPEYKINSKKRQRKIRAAKPPSVRYRQNPAELMISNHKRVNSKKINVLKHYGGLKCAECDINDLDMLTIDHINNGGKVHREMYGNKVSIHNMLIKEGYPPGFQVLCFNHNVKKERTRRRKEVKERYIQLKKN